MCKVSLKLIAHTGPLPAIQNYSSKSKHHAGSERPKPALYKFHHHRLKPCSLTISGMLFPIDHHTSAIKPARISLSCLLTRHRRTGGPQNRTHVHFQGNPITDHTDSGAILAASSTSKRTMIHLQPISWPLRTRRVAQYGIPLRYKLSCLGAKSPESTQQQSTKCDSNQQKFY